ncbi:MAG: hypothetical protein LKE40_01200 [Spirochaetia bacterium]|jgi:hypothetical protein|nr:hypothetical protein [Spirochaetia bacterium]
MNKQKQTKKIFFYSTLVLAVSLGLTGCKKQSTQQVSTPTATAATASSTTTKTTTAQPTVTKAETATTEATTSSNKETTTATKTATVAATTATESSTVKTSAEQPKAETTKEVTAQKPAAPTAATSTTTAASSTNATEQQSTTAKKEASTTGEATTTATKTAAETTTTAKVATAQPTATKEESTAATASSATTAQTNATEETATTSAAASTKKATTEATTTTATGTTAKEETKTAVSATTTEATQKETAKAENTFNASDLGFTVKDAKLYFKSLLLSNSSIAQDTSDATSETYTLEDGTIIIVDKDGTITAKLPNQITIKTDAKLSTFTTGYGSSVSIKLPLTSFSTEDNGYKFSYGKDILIKDTPQELSASYGKLTLLLSGKKTLISFAGQPLETSAITSFSVTEKGFELSLKDGAKISADATGTYTYSFQNGNAIKQTSDGLTIVNSNANVLLAGNFAKAAYVAETKVVTLTTDKNDAVMIDLEGNVQHQKSTEATKATSTTKETSTVTKTAEATTAEATTAEATTAEATTAEATAAEATTAEATTAEATTAEATTAEATTAEAATAEATTAEATTAEATTAEATTAEATTATPAKTTAPVSQPAAITSEQETTVSKATTAKSPWAIQTSIKGDLYYQDDLSDNPQLGISGTVGATYLFTNGLKGGLSIDYTYGAEYNSNNSSDKQRMDIKALIRKDFKLVVPVYVQASAGAIINLDASDSLATPFSLGIETGTLIPVSGNTAVMVGIGDEMVFSSDAFGNNVYGTLGLDFSL